LVCYLLSKLHQHVFLPPLHACRVDGRNVNQWHWEERSIKNKVQERLGELFCDLPLDSEGKPGSFKISSLKETTGEVSLGFKKVLEFGGGLGCRLDQATYKY